MTIRCKADVPADRLQALVNLGPQHSPVFDMVTHGLPVDVQIEAL